MNLVEVGRKIGARVTKTLEDGKYREVCSDYDFRGYKRIYFVHIRKTGGTSLNHIFLSLASDDAGSLYEELARTPGHRLMSNGKVYVGWNVCLINGGMYYYAFSHTPLHELNLPSSTFTFSCFRDPVKRLTSHYNMLKGFSLNGIQHPCMATEGKWLGSSFDDFLERIPQEALLNQLYMFSAEYNVDQATENVADLSHFFFTESFESGIEGLNMKTGLNLKPMHIRKASYRAEISEASIAKARSMLVSRQG